MQHWLLLSVSSENVLFLYTVLFGLSELTKLHIYQSFHTCVSSSVRKLVTAVNTEGKA